MKDLLMVVLCVLAILAAIATAIFSSVREGIGIAIVSGVWLMALDAIIESKRKKDL